MQFSLHTFLVTIDLSVVDFCIKKSQAPGVYQHSFSQIHNSGHTNAGVVFTAMPSAPHSNWVRILNPVSDYLLMFLYLFSLL